MTTTRLYFALWNRNRRISWTFHIQILYNKFTLHTLQTIFTLYTLFTDVNSFTGVIETLLTKFAFPESDRLRPVLRIIAPRADMSNYENKKIPQKTGLASYLVSKSHGSEVRNCRDQWVFFPPRHDRGFAAQFSPQTTGKTPSGTQGTILSN